MMGIAVIGIYLLFWVACIIGAIILFIYVLKQRLREKKEEEKKHKDYDQY